MRSDSNSLLDYPSQELLKKTLDRCGIDIRRSLIAYDDFGMLGSAKFAFIMESIRKKVHILNGSLAHWKQEGYPTDKKGLKPPRQLDNYIGPNRSKINLFANSVQVCSSLSRACRSGEPTTILLDTQTQSHPSGQPFPFSFNFPIKNLLTEDGLLLPIPELRKIFYRIGIDLQREIFIQADDQISNCLLYYALKDAGVSVTPRSLSSEAIKKGFVEVHPIAGNSDYDSSVAEELEEEEHQGDEEEEE